jgi:hypothetical protein
METWSTTLEWIAAQFNDRCVEGLTDLEFDIVDRLMGEGYLKEEKTLLLPSKDDDSTMCSKLMYVHLP